MISIILYILHENYYLNYNTHVYFIIIIMMFIERQIICVILDHLFELLIETAFRNDPLKCSILLICGCGWLIERDDRVKMTSVNNPIIVRHSYFPYDIYSYVVTPLCVQHDDDCIYVNM